MATVANIITIFAHRQLQIDVFNNIQLNAHWMCTYSCHILYIITDGYIGNMFEREQFLLNAIVLYR